MICSVVNNHHIGGKKTTKTKFNAIFIRTKSWRKKLEHINLFCFEKIEHGTIDFFIRLPADHIYNYRIEIFEKLYFQSHRMRCHIIYDTKNFCNTVLISMKRGSKEDQFFSGKKQCKNVLWKYSKKI